VSRPSPQPRTDLRHSPEGFAKTFATATNLSLLLLFFVLLLMSTSTPYPLDVEFYNQTFLKYPKLIGDKGWIYGVWYCGMTYQRKLYGQYPPTFLRRALSLFPSVDPKRILHCPSGSLNGDVPGVSVDCMRDEIWQPQIIAAADCLPFSDCSFDLVLSDPPYSDAHSREVQHAPLPAQKEHAEFHRILARGGYFGLLHFRYPSFKRTEWEMRALIGVVTGSNRNVRVFTIFQKL
jgi:hypothetical protein